MWLFVSARSTHIMSEVQTSLPTPFLSPTMFMSSGDDPSSIKSEINTTEQQLTEAQRERNDEDVQISNNENDSDDTTSLMVGFTQRMEANNQISALEDRLATLRGKLTEAESGQEDRRKQDRIAADNAQRIRQEQEARLTQQAANRVRQV